MKKSIILGAGCFWGVQAAFKLMKGVISTDVGYSGGQVKNPTYEQVCSKNTGHIEVVKIVFEDKLVTLSEIITLFLAIHDPTQEDGQGNDIGPQYSSVIFYENQEEKREIENLINSVRSNYSSPIFTKVRPTADFFKAEDYHQDYLSKNPGGYCHINLSAVKEFLVSKGFGLE